MQLVAVTDLRTKDTDGKKVLLDDPAVCERCHKPHAIVYHVEDDNGKVWEVGSTCCKILFGWMPSKNEVYGAQEGRKLGEAMKRNGYSVDKVWYFVCKYYRLATDGERSHIYDYARKVLAS